MSEVPAEEVAGNGAAVIEIVGRFGDRESFRAAVEELRANGFERSELSILDTRESLSASESAGEAWAQALAGLIGEVKYLGPITAAGLIMIASGPVGAAVSGLMAAGLTGVALKELLDDIKATPHTETFARALEAGAVLLWVRAEMADRQTLASDILSRHGAGDVHLHRRDVRP
ncbi:MAG: hypothetical protein V3R55_04340 [Alphaproteobacteria bacterium]